MNRLKSEALPSSVRAGVYKIPGSFRVRLLVTLALIAVLAARVDPEKVSHILGRFDPSIGLIMLGVNMLLIVLFARRWQVIASALNFKPPRSQMIRAIWLAQFLGQFGPTLLIAEATRFRMLRNYATKSQLITSQVLDRVSGQIILFLMVVAMTPWYALELNAEFWKWLASLAALILLVLWILRFAYRLRSLPQNATRLASDVLGRSGLSGHYALSLIIQLLLILDFSLAAAGLGIRDELPTLMIRLPLVFAALTLLPITISDWGSREAAAAILLSSSGLDPETIVSISVVYGFFHLLAALPGGLFLIYGRDVSQADCESNGNCQKQVDCNEFEEKVFTPTDRPG